LKLDNNINKISKKIIKEHKLCDNCLGRQFSKKIIKNKSLGSLIRKQIKVKQTRKSCFICEGMMANIQKNTNKIIAEIEKFECSTFMLGTILNSEFMEREDFIRAEYKIKGGETIKSEITKETSKIISQKLNKKVSLTKPDINILVDNIFDIIKITPKSIFIYGFYMKSIRGINQKKKRCNECKTKGCNTCNFKGFDNRPSVEEEIQKHLINKFNAKNIIISWVGSEDSKSLVKNNGRPFFAEIQEPAKRKVIFRNKKMNHGIIIKNIKILNKKPPTDYHFILEVKVNIKSNCSNKKKIKKLESQYKEKEISVFSTNKNKYFTRKIYSLEIKKIIDKRFSVKLICEGGINIKKLISGENNEIDPSFSQILKAKCSTSKRAPFDIYKVKLKNEQLIRLQNRK
jgi:tRNA pseudouridine synthase 10